MDPKLSDILENLIMNEKSIILLIKSLAAHHGIDLNENTLYSHTLNLIYDTDQLLKELKGYGAPDGSTSARASAHSVLYPHLEPMDRGY